jgi:hypothetical protein
MAIILTGSTGVATPAVTDASGGNTATINSMTPTADSLQGFRNRIINGDMRIDQRNAGASVTATGYPVDRFFGEDGSDAVFTLQQDSSAPTGFTKSVKATITTADASIGATQYGIFAQYIEGTNVADLGFGSASAKTVTLSFWVRSSLTGTFGGVLTNSGFNRSYPFTYTISVADTWEQKSVTIAGDTTGTWLTTTGVGFRVIWSLGSGSTYSATAGSWTSTSTILGATGQTQVISTLNATWYITGAQLEVGSVATPFERRDYGRELAMCQRYYYKIQATVSDSPFSMGSVTTTTVADIIVPFPVSMRTNPTALEQTGTAGDYRVRTQATDTVCSAVPTLINSATTTTSQVRFTVASGLTAGNAAIGRSVNSSAYLAWSAEL